MTNTKKELIRTIKFVLFSASAGIIQVLSFTLMEEGLHLEHWISYLVSLVLSVLWNFTLNRKFTFYSASNIPIAMMKVAVFYVIFTPLSTWWTAVLTGESMAWNEYLVLAGTMAINFVTEYLYNRPYKGEVIIDDAMKASIDAYYAQYGCKK
jgi:putative flippase GtrA